MSKEANEFLSGQIWCALALLTLGMMLLVYCVLVESEPGGISLLLILGSSTWLIIARILQVRKRKPARIHR